MAAVPNATIIGFTGTPVRSPTKGAGTFEIFGSQDATLYCLDGAGKQVWKHTIGDQIRCFPTVVANRAFVAGCDSTLHIIDLDTGKSTGGVPI